MRAILLIMSFLWGVFAGAVEPDVMTRKAARAFDGREWASAQAMYSLVTDSSPGDTGAHARLLTATLMRGDSAAVADIAERALKGGVSLGALLDSLRVDLRAVGGYGLYAPALDRIAADKPYLRRPVASYQLDYYTERRDGVMMERYARQLLAGLPDSPEYLDALAWGLLYQDRRDEAEAAWRRALAADPGNARVMVSLAAMLGDTPEAVTLLERADSIAPSPAIRARLRQSRDRR